MFAAHHAPTYARLARRVAAVGGDDLAPLIALAGLRLAFWQGRARDPFAGGVNATIEDLTALRDELADASAAGLVQFTEPQRITDVVPGLLLAARSYPGRAIRLVEFGAGAGIVLTGHRVVVDFATGRWPGRGVDLGLTADLVVPPELLAVDLPIVSAVGIDRRPLDVRDAGDSRRLRAFAWPDRPARLERLDAAVAAAVAVAPNLVRGDVLDIAPDLLADLVEPDVVTVVIDSAFSGHLAPADRARLTAVLRTAARTGIVVVLSRVRATHPTGWRLSAMQLRDLTGGRTGVYCVGDLLSERLAWVGPS